MTELEPMLRYFPLAEPRTKQVLALERAFHHASSGVQDIVIAAPTGIGKTGIGAAVCLWASQSTAPEDYKPGGYYLITQKLLQDQLERDFPKFTIHNDRCATLKSAVEYECPEYSTCMAGRRMPKHKKCSLLNRGYCRYETAKTNFNRALLSATNYAYFFTERSYVGQLPKRRVMVCDECHTLERQLMRFIEFSVGKDALEKWAPSLDVPRMDRVDQFIAWVDKVYLTIMRERLEMLHGRLMTEYADWRVHDEFTKLENHVNRISASTVDIATNPDNWVYWQQDNGVYRESIAKPLFTHSFVPPLILEPAHLRVYMSAYPGPKRVFCRSLGLDPAKVAWLNLNSTFPPANRPVHVLSVGSMGRKSLDESLPKMVHVTEKLLDKHPEEKGIIHCHSYALGTALYQHLRNTDHAPRVLFARKASERAACLRRHVTSEEPTVLLSPSMSEGFSLDDDLARFQIIAKVPYPYLGDQQIAARKDLDPEWYILQTAAIILQACGRIVRSDTDYGTTYILDSDFERLFDENREFFPQWFVSSLVWRTK